MVYLIICIFSRTIYSFEGPTIVYCRTKDMTNRVETELHSEEAMLDV